MTSFTHANCTRTAIDNTATVAATPVRTSDMSNAAFATPSFLSPDPVGLASDKPALLKQQQAQTLSGGERKKKKKTQKRKLDGELLLASSTAKGEENDCKLDGETAMKYVKKQKTRVKSGNTLTDISNQINGTTPSHEQSRKQRGSSTPHVPTRKLLFSPTVVKEARVIKRQDQAKEKSQKSQRSLSSSSSSSSSSESESISSASSDECEVSFDAVTIGNARIIRESFSPISMASTSSSMSSIQPVGLEYRFSVSSTVCSAAIAPSGKFLVVGFYNGTIYLYPLTKDALRFRRGVLLDHITARGMYTQLMVRVAIPDDGKFIFAGVYRGSTDIRAYEVDSIKFPSSLTAGSSASKRLFDGNNSERDNSDDDDDDDSGLPTAQAIAHTYSDAKLKGFGAVKSVFRSATNKTEYHLLCGLGIKNIHLWRFFQLPNANEWRWECIFDKQTNGISLEFIGFHRTIPNQIISKSEHQNIRIWTLEEEIPEGDSMLRSVTMQKKSHVDVKQTVDTSVVYSDYAYGGGETLAVVDLRDSSRLELGLPLSAKEQDAQLEAANSQKMHTRMLPSFRGRSSRRRGGSSSNIDDLGGMRLMRTVSQVAGRDDSPFIVGMCTDGSVFLHNPQPEMGLDTPLEYIEGYEQFFQDPSLSFQAQFSDLTRVNTSGLLSVQPLPENEKEDWVIIAANQDELLVRSLKAFLCRNQQKKEYVAVRNGLRRVMRDLGAHSSSSSSDNSGSSADENENSEDESRAKVDKKSIKKESTSRSATKKLKSSNNSTGQSKTAGVKQERAKTKASKPSGIAAGKYNGKVSMGTEKLSAGGKDGTHISNEKMDTVTVAAVGGVTTPKRRTGSNTGAVTLAGANVPSPVVSLSSLSSGSSNPNTPEQAASLTMRQKQIIALKELEWTPQAKGSAVSVAESALLKVSTGKENEYCNTPGAAFPLGIPATSVYNGKSKSEDINRVNGKTRSKKEKQKPRMKAQALFVNSEHRCDESSHVIVSVNQTDQVTESAVEVKSLVKNGSEKVKQSKRSDFEPFEPIISSNIDLETPKNDQNQVEVVDQELPDTATEDGTMVECEEEDEEMDELEELEKQEPQWLLSDKSTLLMASMFQYLPQESNTLDVVEHEEPLQADHLISNEQANLLMQFSQQNERLKMNYLLEKERIYKQHDCSCGSAHLSRKKSATSINTTPCGASKMNWRKSLSNTFLKRKQLKRRQKKQIAAKLRQLQANYHSQINDLVAMQRLQANAVHARQQFDHFYQQFRQPEEAALITLPHQTPQQLSISFPYPNLL